jgi:2-oxo-3-hexenedioate decarboxylase
MSTWSVDRAATELLDAQDTPAARGPLTDEWRDLDLRVAYTIQDEMLCRRVERGEHVVGVKLGLTSRAKQKRMGISSPLVAWLTDAMTLPAGAPLSGGSLIHPRAEPELVFVMKERLSGPGVTAPRAMSAVGRVYGGIEIIDSRYRDFRFTLPDVVADNASAARYLIGSIGLAPEQLDLALEACLVEVDGVIVDSATGAAVQGHPAEALALAANTLAERGLAIEPGWIVLTGGMTDAVPVGPGAAVRVHFSHLGSLVVHRGR